MAICGVGLGGNLGDTDTLFRKAIESFHEFSGRLPAVSSSVRSAPMGQNSGGVFVNAVATFESDASAHHVLAFLHDVESRLGRERLRKWAPRTIDLDLLFYGTEVIETPRLVVPHPALWFRWFVVYPLAEIAADWTHPVLNEAVSSLGQRFQHSPLTLEISGHDGLVVDVSAASTALERMFGAAAFRLKKAEVDSEISEAVFARVEFRRSSGMMARTQPDHESTRRIVIDVDSSGWLSGMQSLVDICTACRLPAHLKVSQ